MTTNGYDKQAERELRRARSRAQGGTGVQPVVSPVSQPEESPALSLISTTPQEPTAEEMQRVTRGRSRRTPESEAPNILKTLLRPPFGPNVPIAALQELWWLKGKLDEEFVEPAAEVVSSVIDLNENFSGDIARKVLGLSPREPLLRSEIRRSIEDSFEREGFLGGLNALREGLKENRRQRGESALGARREIFPLELFITSSLVDPLSWFPGWGLGGKLPGVAGKAGGRIENEFTKAASGLVDIPVNMLRRLPASAAATKRAAKAKVAEDFRVVLGDIYEENAPGTGIDAINGVMNRVLAANTGKMALNAADARLLGVIKGSADENPETFWRFADGLLEKSPQELVRDFSESYVERMALKAKGVRLAERKAGDLWTGHLLYTLETVGDAVANQAVLRRMGRLVQTLNRANARVVLMTPGYMPLNAAENGIRMGIDGVTPGVLNQADFVSLMRGYRGIPEELFSTEIGYGEAALSGIVREGVPQHASIYQKMLDRLPPPAATWTERLRNGVNILIGPGAIRASSVFETAAKRHALTVAGEQELVKLLKSELRRSSTLTAIYKNFVTETPAGMRSDIAQGLVKRMMWAVPQGSEAIQRVGSLLTADTVNRQMARGLLAGVKANLDPVSHSLLSEAVSRGPAEGIPAAIERAKELYVARTEAELPRLLKLGEQMMEMLDVEIGRLELARVMSRFGRVRHALVLNLRKELQLVQADIFDMPRRLVEANVLKARSLRDKAARQAAYLQNDVEETAILEFSQAAQARILKSLGELGKYITKADIGLVKAHSDWSLESLGNLTKHMTADRSFISKLNAERERIGDEMYFTLRDSGRSAIWAEHGLEQIKVAQKFFKAVEPGASPAQVVAAAHAAVGAADTQAAFRELDSLASALQKTISHTDPAFDAAVKDYAGNVRRAYEFLPTETAERLKGIGQNAVDRAMVRFRNTFTNYDSENVLDAVARNVDPFWIYHTRLLGYMARAGATHPALAYAFMPDEGRWWENYPDGKVAINPGVALNPLAGTGFNRLRWMFQDFFPQRETGLVGFMEFLERGANTLPVEPASFGLTFGPFLRTSAFVADRFFGGTVDIAEILPTNISILSGAAGAVSPETGEILRQVLGGDFYNYRIQLELLEQFGKRAEDATPEEKLKALREANLKTLYADVIPLIRYVPEKRNQLRKVVDAEAERRSGLPAGTFQRLRDEGKSPYDLVPTSPLFTQEMKERFQAYEAMLSLGDILQREDIRKSNDAIERFWEASNAFRESLYEEQLVDDEKYQRGEIAFEVWEGNRRTRASRVAERMEAVQAESVVPISEEMLRNLSQEERDILLTGKQLQTEGGKTFVRVPLSEPERLLYRRLRGREIPVLHPLQQVVEDWYSITPEAFGLPGGETDWDAFAEARNHLLELIPEKVTLPAVELPDIGVTGKPVEYELRKEFFAYLSRHETPLERQMRDGSLTYMRSWRALDSDVADWLRSSGAKRETVGEYLSTDEEASRLERESEIAVRAGDDAKALGLRHIAARLRAYKNNIKERYRGWLSATLPIEQARKVKEWLRLFNPQQYLSYWRGRG